MHSFTDTVDVARVLRVPARGRMAQVGSCCEEHFEGYLGGLGRVAEDIFGVVGGFHGGAKFVEFSS